MTTVRMRTLLAFFNMANFVVMIILTAYVLTAYSGQLQDWWLALYAYYIVLGCCGVAISVWIGIDGKRLERYAQKIKKLENKLSDLEKKIRLIKR
jgi:ABC-type tungstate transport system substrate-binding protein